MFYICTRMKKINIAIDGLSGCGKSSTAKAVAKALAYRFIDTGAMYRAVTLYFLQNGVDWSNAQEVEDALSEIEIDFHYNPQTGKNETILNKQNVEKEIRKMMVSDQVSSVSAVKAVRIAMVAQQQEMGRSKGVVMDGRDIGSVVFPNAELKVFMSASTQVRAKRRKLELEEKGEIVELEEIVKNLESRDEQDSTRAESPLVKVDDAVEIDTSGLQFEDQVQKVLDLARACIDAE